MEKTSSTAQATETLARGGRRGLIFEKKRNAIRDLSLSTQNKRGVKGGGDFLGIGLRRWDYPCALRKRPGKGQRGVAGRMRENKKPLYMARPDLEVRGTWGRRDGR